MDNLEIENTKKTPIVRFKKDGHLKILGRSIPEDPAVFYDSLLLWIKKYAENPARKTTFDFELEYFNSGTSKYFLQILKELKKIKMEGHQIEINWYFEVGDDDILERGEYFASILDLDLNFLQIDYE